MNYINLYTTPQAQQKEIELGFDTCFVEEQNLSHSKKQSVRVKVLIAANCDSLIKLINSPISNSIILATPFSTRGFFKEEALYALIGVQAAKSQPIGFHIPLTGLYDSQSVFRCRFAYQASKFFKKAQKYRCPVCLTSGARNIWEAKSPTEHISIATSLYGMSKIQASYALSTEPLNLIENTSGV